MKKAKFAVLGGQSAGKTSILRRYFQGTFYGDCRLPTVGVDVYSTIASTSSSTAASTPIRTPIESSREASKKKTNDRDEEEKKGETNDTNTVGNDNDDISTSTSTSTGTNDNISTMHRTTPEPTTRRPISIQVWDTPGRERFVNTDGKKRCTASFSDRFLKDLDAVCLVYDVSSSTSFTHVLKWYYELMERLRRMKANHERRRHLPIVIVGNKIDIIQDRENVRRFRRQQEELLRNRRKEIVVQRRRNVLGLEGKNWRGRDYRYEYASSSSKQPSRHTRSGSSSTSNSNSNSNSNSTDKNSNNEHGRENRLELLTYLGTNTNYLEAILNNEVYRGSYLDSLLSSEDNSHPDKDMVELWCTRNGLIHMDVSAKSGAGIGNLIDQLVDIALKQMDDETGTAAELSAAATAETIGGSDTALLLQRNKELDLHQRYGPKSSSCLPFPLSVRCCRCCRCCYR